MKKLEMPSTTPRNLLRIAFLSLCLCVSTGALAAPGDAGLRLELIPQSTTVAPGESFQVAMVFTLGDEWAMYSPDPQSEFAMPLGLTATATGVKPAVEVGPWRFQPDTPKTSLVGDERITINSYTGRTVAFATVTVPKSAQGTTLTITATPNGQTCDAALCVPIQPYAGEPLTATARVTLASETISNPEWKPVEKDEATAMTVEQLQASHQRTPAPAPTAMTDRSASTTPEETSFGSALWIALLAGLLLNIMPCVLPVIPIRILSIVQMAGDSKRRFVTMGIAFAAGMMLFFVCIAAVNLILQLTISRGFNLNEMFQYPVAVIIMSGIVVALAANLFGLFNVLVPNKLANLDSQVASQKAGHWKSAGMGFMMAVLATPCSFAFLASALLYAQTASLAAGTTVLLAIGVGMSLPHAMLAAFPKLIDRLPKPGRWMELFKQTTGFLLLLIALWIVSSQRGEGASIYPWMIVAWLVLLTLGLWIASSWVRYDAPARKKWAVRCIALAVVIAPAPWLLTPPAPPAVKAIAFDWSQIEQARQQGRPVLIKVTATWCIKCAQMDATTLSDPAVVRAIEANDVLYVKADITTKQMPAAKWLAEQGYGSTAPLLFIYPPAGQRLGPFYGSITVDELVAALDQAGQ